MAGPLAPVCDGAWWSSSFKLQAARLHSSSLQTLCLWETRSLCSPALAGLRNIRPTGPKPIERQEMTDYVGQAQDAVAQAFTGFGDGLYLPGVE